MKVTARIKKFIDAKAQQIRTKLGIDPERWKAGIVSRTDAILRIPYVWEAVEELAQQLENTEGAYAIPARQVRRVLRTVKEEGAFKHSPIPAEPIEQALIEGNPYSPLTLILRNVFA